MDAARRYTRIREKEIVVDVRTMVMTGCRNMPFFRCSMYIWMIWLMGLACALPARAEFRQYSNLPTLYVETFNGRGITSKTDYVFCRLVMVDGLDTIHYDSVQIRGRGNSTWNMEKKPYRLKFKTSCISIVSSIYQS